MTDNPRIIIENEKCKVCPSHGACPIEFVGGEDNLLTAKEMDEVTALTEVGIGNLIKHWDAHGDDRDALGALLGSEYKKGNKKFILASTKKGADYYQFALRQAQRMEFISKEVLDILMEATQRADDAFRASKAVKN